MTTIIFFKQPVTNDALAKPNGARQTAKGMTASRSQRRVATQIHFLLWREPAQLVILALRNKIGSFSQVVLRSNRLELRILEPLIQRTYSRRIATEDFIGKRVDLVNRNLHNDLPNTKC